MRQERPRNTQAAAGVWLLVIALAATACELDEAQHK